MTHNQRNWGLSYVFCICNVKGFGWNHKRVYHIYRELGLKLWIKPNKRLIRQKPDPLTVPEAINEVWSMDFMHDQLSDAHVSGNLQAWSETRDIQIEYIQPGKLQQNAYIKRYNRTVRYD